ncbi:MAG: hypothetical protein HZC40_11945 [Chloroflexi bacterium]|nr:hypothetical protein [Chloroflexota bacterium]
MNHLSVKLLVAWGCGLLWGASLIIMVGLSLSRMRLVGLFAGGGDLSPEATLGIWLCWLAMFGSPSLLGFFLARNWRSVLIGLCAAPVGVIGVLACYWLINVPIATLFEYLGLSSIAQSYVVAFTSLVSAFAAPVIGVVVLGSTKPYPHRLKGLGIGLIAGVALVFGSGILLSQTASADANIFHLLWQAPPLVWVSVVYLMECF